MSTAFHTTDELRAALTRLVPAMAGGLTITTPSGESLSLLPGRLADRLADELCIDLMLVLKHREQRETVGRSS